MSKTLLDRLLCYYPKCNYLSDLPDAVKNEGVDKLVVIITSFKDDNVDVKEFEDLAHYLFHQEKQYHTIDEAYEDILSTSVSFA